MKRRKRAWNLMPIRAFQAEEFRTVRREAGTHKKDFGNTTSEIAEIRFGPDRGESDFRMIVVDYPITLGRGDDIQLAKE